MLKSEGRSSKDLGSILGKCEQTVNSWLDRWQAAGVVGLKAGRGAKPKPDKITDVEQVKQFVKNNRQRLLVAKAALEKELSKQFNTKTLNRFVKKWWMLQTH